MIRTSVRRGFTALLAAAVAAGVTAVAAPAVGEERVTLVVVLQDSADPAAVGKEMARQHRGQVAFVYEHALTGFSISVPEQAAQAISRDERVRYLERDQVFRTAATSEVPTGVARTFAPANAELDIDGTDDFRVDVDVAVIDTGVDSAHPDLHVFAATNCSGGSPLRGSCSDGSAPDGNGHGTHVAGSVAALDNGAGVVGIAPGARLHAVKVLSDSGSGYTSWIIAGIDWVTKHATTIEVANMSLGCECFSQAQDDAITRSVDAGVTYAVAAGNSDKDSETFSPANHPDVITVSALADFDGAAGGLGQATCRADQDDTLADFSNFGPGVEIAAPGVCITSTWPGGGYDTISGTSMASPHAAGAAALLASSDPAATPALIEERLVTAGNTDWTDDSGDGIREKLLDVSSTTVFNPALVATTSTTEPPPAEGAVTLTAQKRIAKNGTFVDLAWTGSSSVDVFRNGSRIASVTGSSYTDKVRSSGTYTYKVCDTSTGTCSNEASVTV